MDDTSDEPPHPVAGQFPAASTPLTDRSYADKLHDSFSYGHHATTRYQNEAIRTLNARPERPTDVRKNRKPSDESLDSLVDNTARWDSISARAWGATTAGFIGYQIAKHYDILEPAYAFAANLLK